MEIQRSKILLHANSTMAAELINYFSFNMWKSKLTERLNDSDNGNIAVLIKHWKRCFLHINKQFLDNFVKACIVLHVTKKLKESDNGNIADLINVHL